MTKKQIIRQGDVLLSRIADLPKDAKDITPDGGRIILAQGEATGHAHVIERTPEAKAPAVYFDAKAERFLQVIETTALAHEEHSAVILERGVYKQGFQVEEKRAEILRVAD